MMKKKTKLEKLNSIRYISYFVYSLLVLYTHGTLAGQCLSLASIIIYLLSYAFLSVALYYFLLFFNSKEINENKVEKLQLNFQRTYLKDLIVVLIISYFVVSSFDKTCSLQDKIAVAALVFVPGLILNYIITKKVYSLKD